MQNSILVFTFFVLDHKYPFWENLIHQNYQFKVKLNTSANQNMQNTIVMFRFSVLDRKYPFLENLVQKIKLVSLSSNLVPRLI